MKQFWAVVVVTCLFTFAAGVVEAKLLPQAKQGTKATVARSSGGGIGVYPRISANRRALIVNFSNLGNAKNVSYLLTYKTDAQDEAAMGGLNLSGNNSQTSELLFGTCSRNVCRYHTGIKDARFEVSYTTTSGKKYLKKYKVKI